MKTIPRILINGAIVLGLSGCAKDDFSKYEFHGKIGDNQIDFYHRMTPTPRNTLRVRGKDCISYSDYVGNDLKIECVEGFNPDGTEYSRNLGWATKEEEKLLKQDQKDFDKWLEKIVAEKAKQAKNN